MKYRIIYNDNTESQPFEAKSEDDALWTFRMEGDRAYKLEKIEE